MKLVFYSDILNHHQAPVADALWELTEHQFCFVELKEPIEYKGGGEDYSARPYLLRSWEGTQAYSQAMELARTADCCVFAGVTALPFQKERLRRNLLSLEMGERWLKYGWKSLLSPRLLQWLWAYYSGAWSKKPLYKLCCSAFCAEDHARMGTYKGKCYKWGYFPAMAKEPALSRDTEEELSIICCARFLGWKHPELPVLLAARLKEKGYRFHLDMYGTGELEPAVKELAAKQNLDDVLHFHGAVPNAAVREAMRNADLFLLTSDRYEGWGVVLNESMMEGCVPLASSSVGSAPYLLKDGENGFVFQAPAPQSSCKCPDRKALQSLTAKTEWLLLHPEERKIMGEAARKTIHELWNPRKAAQNLIELIACLQAGKEPGIQEGPCSKA